MNVLPGCGPVKIVFSSCMREEEVLDRLFFTHEEPSPRRVRVHDYAGFGSVLF
jgi:hypothetical protein